MNELAFIRPSGRLGVRPFGRRLGHVAIIASALFANSAAAIAQPEPMASPPSLQSVLGREVTPPKGRGVESGRIIDVLIDGEGRVHAFVVEFGGFLGIGTRKLAVDRAAFQFVDDKIFVEISGHQLQAAREWTRGEPPDVLKAASPPRD